MQMTLMTIQPNEEIGLEVHDDHDQFLRIEQRNAKVLMRDSEHDLSFNVPAEEDFAIFVPAGKWHNIINTGQVPLKLYSIYAPSEHPFGTVHQTKAEADAAEHHE